MNSLMLYIKHVRWLALAVCLLPLVLSSAVGQTVGTITGRVYDQRTGKSLEGAVVRAVGTNAIDYTTSDGRFSLSVPPGTANVEVEYVGLDTIRRTVNVTA